VVAIYCRVRPELAQPSEPLPWNERWKALLGVWPIATIFLILFGGIYTGLFTPTEGAAVGAIGTFLAGLAKRELTLSGIKRSFLGTAETSA
ncbi:TRAP transporter large permease subunit, partial [Escherichia coli]|nr:TRAP transporter large permease subunit [Escherichia coli]